jgi:hypothetical protein
MPGLPKLFTNFTGPLKLLNFYSKQDGNPQDATMTLAGRPNSKILYLQCTTETFELIYQAYHQNA